jgi:hypothetical protein
MKNELKLIDGYWIVFFCFDDMWMDKFGKVVAQYPLTECTGSEERLAIAKETNVNPCWDFYGMINIKDGKIHGLNRPDGGKYFVGMNKESTAFYNFDSETFNIISYYKI